MLRRSRDLRLGAALGLDQIADQLGECQNLVSQHQTTELCTPLGAFLQNADEVAKFFNGERHACLAAERDQELKGTSTNQSLDLRWQKISAFSLADAGDLCNVHRPFRVTWQARMLQTQYAAKAH